jgi:hypothetical protein
MIPIDPLVGIIEIIRHQVPDPAGPVCHHLGIGRTMPTPALGFRPQFAPERLRPSEMTEVAGVSGMS